MVPSPLESGSPVRQHSKRILSKANIMTHNPLLQGGLVHGGNFTRDKVRIYPSRGALGGGGGVSASTIVAFCACSADPELVDL
eukprot:scaffold36667_cov35-Tisochrysis_lutea.AAC.1